MQDIRGLSKSEKDEIAQYIKRDHLAAVNAKVEMVHVRESFYTRYGKRVLDVMTAMFALVLTAPINMVIAVVTFFDVGRPIIFKQQRIGQGERKFIIYKFRNMVNDSDANGELLPPSQRVTRWGRFVRRTSLDELLNFVSVLNGSMSIIGPRPLLDYYEERLHDRHKAIYAVRPGLECPTLHSVDHTLSWQERLDNYVWYVENCSFLLDIRLMFRMVQMVFDRKGNKVRADANNGGLLGYDLSGNVIYTRAVPDEYVDEFCRNHGFTDLDEAVAARNGEFAYSDVSLKEDVKHSEVNTNYQYIQERGA